MFTVSILNLHILENFQVGSITFPLHCLLPQKKENPVLQAKCGPKVSITERLYMQHTLVEQLLIKLCIGISYLFQITDFLLENFRQIMITYQSV